MSHVKFKEFYNNSKNLLFRDLIKKHFKKTPYKELNIQAIGSALKGNVIDEADYNSFVQKIHYVFMQSILYEGMLKGTSSLKDGNTPYKTMTIEDAFDLMTDMLQDFYWNSEQIERYEFIRKCIDDFDNLKDDQDEFLWDVFQSITLELAYQLSINKDNKKLFCIKTGFFG